MRGVGADEYAAAMMPTLNRKKRTMEVGQVYRTSSGQMFKILGVDASSGYVWAVAHGHQGEDSGLIVPEQTWVKWDLVPYTSELIPPAIVLVYARPTRMAKSYRLLKTVPYSEINRLTNYMRRSEPGYIFMKVIFGNEQSEFEYPNTRFIPYTKSDWEYDMENEDEDDED